MSNLNLNQPQDLNNDEIYQNNISVTLQPNNGYNIGLGVPTGNGNLHITGVHLSVEVDSKVQFIMSLNTEFGVNKHSIVPIAFNQEIHSKTEKTVYICNNTVDVYQRFSNAGGGGTGIPRFSLSFRILPPNDLSPTVFKVNGLLSGVVTYKPLIFR